MQKTILPILVCLFFSVNMTQHPTCNILAGEKKNPYTFKKVWNCLSNTAINCPQRFSRNLRFFLMKAANARWIAKTCVKQLL